MSDGQKIRNNPPPSDDGGNDEEQRKVNIRLELGVNPPQKVEVSAGPNDSMKDLIQKAIDKTDPDFGRAFQETITSPGAVTQANGKTVNPSDKVTQLLGDKTDVVVSSAQQLRGGW